MPSMKIRQTRSLRALSAKRRAQMAKTITLSRRGMQVGDHLLPAAMVGADVSVEHIGNKASIVGVSLLCEKFAVDGPLHRGCTIAQSWH